MTSALLAELCSKQVYCTDLLILILLLFMFYSTRVEEYAKEDMDLTLMTTLEFSTPFADLSDVKTMMDSINVVPGLKHKLHKCLCKVSVRQIVYIQVATLSQNLKNISRYVKIQCKLL